MEQSSISYSRLLKRIATEGEWGTEESVAADDLRGHLQTSIKTTQSLLEEAEQEDLICIDGTEISLADDGRSKLYQEYLEYQSALNIGDVLELTGRVTSGLGKGSEFVTLDGYQDQFIDKLEYEPFPGTFNIRLTESSAKKRSALSEFSNISIERWERSGNSFGPVSCYSAIVYTSSGTYYHEVHVVVPDRTEHSVRELELLAPVSLREHLGTNDGDWVMISIEP
ncbi:DUF120 domain-containing protein [Halobellus sp. GM3]|uniref:DUF120 domain-containing protein n=1 Tax=Halobellus sp. GM3 TaxID=3458410 RepID=UPI00403E02E8